MADPVDTPIGRVTAGHFHPTAITHQVVMGPKFLYALFNPRDEMHSVSKAFMSFVRDGDLPYRRLIVNEHIIDEAATRLKKRASMRNATQFISTLADSTVYQLEYVSKEVFDEATSTFVQWTDSPAGFTDFVVAAHMEELGVDHIATYDSHYGGFGVTTLPRR